jgi:hypothetical protein
LKQRYSCSIYPETQEASLSDPGEGRWLLLIHQIPPKPPYFRVKVWRRLQRIGAVAIKNSVYAMPRNAEAQEDLQWILREVVEGGGDASLVEARFVEGLSDEHVEALFHAARDADYAQLAEEAREVLGRVTGRRKADPEQRAAFEADLARLQRRLTEVAAIDFFGAPGRMPAESAIGELEERLRPPEAAAADPSIDGGPPRVSGGTWVTRKGIHVDRMASAWLIRRFIDPKARFKFVPGGERTYRPERGELRFDMFEGEYTHEGDRCSFEVLVERFRLRDPGLRPIAEVVHDIDLKDGRFGRPETAGFDHLVAGIALAHREDEDRLARASAVLDDLYAYFKRKR